MLTKFKHPVGKLRRAGFEKLGIYALDHVAKLKSGAEGQGNFPSLLAKTEAKQVRLLKAMRNQHQITEARKKATSMVKEGLAELSSGTTSLRHRWKLTLQMYNLQAQVPYNLKRFQTYANAMREKPMDMRIQTVFTFASSLAGFPELVELQKEVLDTYERLYDLREEQQMYEERIKISREELGQARAEMEAELAYNVNALILHFRDNPQRVGYYFDANLLVNAPRKGADKSELPEQPNAPDAAGAPKAPDASGNAPSGNNPSGDDASSAAA